MPSDSLQTTLLLDAALSGGYEDAFSSASKLMNDLTRHSNALEKEMKALGKTADDLDKVGKASDGLRRDMQKLESQINSSRKAADKFGNAKRHFKNAKIGAAAFKQELSGILSISSKAAVAVAGISTAAGVALAPNAETLAFGDELARLRLIPEMDEARLGRVRDQLLELSTIHPNIELPDLTAQFSKLSRKFGASEAEGLLDNVAQFQQLTGQDIAGNFQVDHDAIVAALNITSAEQYSKLLETLAKGVLHGNLNLENIDAGDLGTLIEAHGSDLNSKELQKALLVALKHKELDSEQFADKFREFMTRRNEAMLIPEIDTSMDLSQLKKVATQQGDAEKNIEIFAKYGINETSTLNDLVETYTKLTDDARKQLVHDLEPLLGGGVLDVLVSAPQGLQTIVEDVEKAVNVEIDMKAETEKLSGSWTQVWRSIGKVGKNTMFLLQSNFAEVFGPSILAGADRLFSYIQSHESDIKNIFTGINDTLTPKIKSVWQTIQNAWPDIKQFTSEAWDELKTHWDTISPAAEWLASKIWSITKSVGGFLKEHPRLIATVIAGIAAWKAYKLVSGGVQTAYDFIAGGANMISGHLYKLNAAAIGNQRELANTGNAALSTGQKFLKMSQHAFATKFPRFASAIGGIKNIGVSAIGTIPGTTAMGASLWAAITPILPVILPIVAAIGLLAGVGYLVYKNWEPLKAFFTDNFETIRNVLTLVFPPIGLLIGLAGVIRDNWEPLKTFFVTLWETLKLGAQIAWEATQFVALHALKLIKDAWGGIKDFFSNIWEGVKLIFFDSPLAPIFQAMVDGVMMVVRPLLGFFSDIWGGISEGFGKVLGWMTERLEGFNNVLGKVLGWFRDENKKMKAELGITQEGTKVGSETVTGFPETTIDSPAVSMPETKMDAPLVSTATPEASMPETKIASPQVEVATPEVSMPDMKMDTPISQPTVAQFNPLSADIEPVVVEKVEKLEQIGTPMPTVQDIQTPDQVSTLIQEGQNAFESFNAEGQQHRDSAATQRSEMQEMPSTPPVPVQVAASSPVSNESKFSITNNFTIYQQPGESAEDLTAKIKAVIESEMRSYQGRLLTE